MGRQGRRSLFPLPIVPRTLSMFRVHVLSGAYYPGTVLIFLLGYPAGTSAEERAFLGVRQTSAESSGKKRGPITAHFQIWEMQFGP